MNSTADMLRQLRESTGLNQKDFAASVGMKQTTYNGYETGKHRPKSDVLMAIANKYNVSVDYLLGVSADQGLPKLRIKSRIKNWKSNKAGRLFMCIDSGLLDLIDIFAREDGISLEDEIEKILHEEAEYRTEEEMSDAADREFSELPPEKLYPHQRSDAPTQTVSEVSMESTWTGQDQPSQQKKPTPVTEDELLELFKMYVERLSPGQLQMIFDQARSMWEQNKVHDQMQRMIARQKAPSSVSAQQTTDETNQ